jgi:HTH-type transcriptional regulator/antitoxin HipB
MRRRWVKDPAFRAASEKIGPEMEMAFAMAEARRRAGLTQADLAQRVGTTQSVIARWESGRTLPSARSLQRVAAATGSRLRVEFVPAGR